MRDVRRRALLMDDEPELHAGCVGVVGDAAEYRVDERVGAQDDEVADPFGAKVQVDQVPEGRGWLEVDRLAEGGEQTVGQRGAAAVGCRLAHNLAERPGVQATQAGERVDASVETRA